MRKSLLRNGQKGSMKFFSAKGEKSTGFERTSFVLAFVIAAAAIAPGIVETVATNRVLANAQPELQARCQKTSDYAPWRFWQSNVQAYATCIVEAKDPDVQNAAGKYLLRGQEGEFKVQESGTSKAP